MFDWKHDMIYMDENVADFGWFVNFAFPAELGDFDEATHTPALISEFRFVQNQNEEFELDVLEAYKKSR